MLMLKHIILFMLKISHTLAFLCFITNIYGNFISVSENEFQPIKGTTIVYLNSQEAYSYLEKTNYFTEQNLLSISLKTKGEINIDSNNLEKLQNQYKEYVSRNLLEWKGHNKSYINKRFTEILSHIKTHTPTVLQDTIFLIKSNKKIEFSSPFTKGKAIIIPESKTPYFSSSLLGLDNGNFEETLAHELFHIYSSNNSNLRESIYSLIGFEKVNNFQVLEELKEMQIINPDDNLSKSEYFKISLKNPNDNNEIQDFIVLILSKHPKYEGYKGLLSRINLIIGYAEIKLARIVNENGNWRVKIKNNKPELYFKNQIPEYWEKIKLTHNITMTPEETLAEDFAILISTKIDKKKLNNLSIIEQQFLRDFELKLQ